MFYAGIAGIALLALASTGAFAQSPTTMPRSPQTPSVPALESRGEFSQQQLLEWQRQRAEEYQRRWREYLATIGRMA